MSASFSRVADAAGTPGERHSADMSELAGHSRTVFAWTVASRLTGFLRTALLAAVLGPTFFGNIVQTALYLPYVICQLLMASSHSMVISESTLMRALTSSLRLLSWVEVLSMACGHCSFRT